MKETRSELIHSAIGEGPLDGNGAAVAVARLDVGKSYKGSDLLLRNFLRDDDQEAWKAITEKIDYTYKALDGAMSALEEETQFLSAISQRLQQGQKLLFKPNLVSTENIDPYTYGPMAGSSGNTEWLMVAAVMRWFHDRAGFSYYRMCLGEAATALSSVAALYR